MLSQDNSPSQSQRSKPQSRVLIGGLWALTLAGFGLVITTTQLHWNVPSTIGDDAAPLTTAAVSQKAIQPSGRPSKETLNATRLARQTDPSTQRLRSAPAPSPITLVPVKPEINSVKLEPASVPLPKVAPRRSIKQPGGDIIISQLNLDHKIPVNNGGMPEFYKIVLEPKGRMTDYGLMQRIVRLNFGYDHQDIFTGEVPNGAYVLHCHQPKALQIRAMCWRELQISDEQWIQYRFPRSLLKDWWKIEQKVRANIG